MSKNDNKTSSKAAATDNKVAAAIRKQINNATAAYTVDELWQLLTFINANRAANPLTQRKISTPYPIPTSNKVKYVSVDDNTAAALIYSYLVTVEESKDSSRNLVRIHKAFLGNVANPTHANRRLLYSYFFRNKCSLPNSIPAKVADAYSKQPVTLDKVQRKFVDDYLTNNPEFAARLRSYKSAHYVRAVVA